MRTIAAISTPLGTGGIAVIRISGDEAFCVTDKVFKGQGAKRLFEVSANTVVFGRICDLDGKEIDQVLVSVFRAPHSFTGEDVVEISCHGGILNTKTILKTVIEAGATLADKGEFSKRAFLNGKIDLAQAEGIIDLINAVSEKGVDTAVFQMEGRLSKEIGGLREVLLNLAAHLEAAADFPEEDIAELAPEVVLATLKESTNRMEKMLKTASYGKVLREGLPVAVIGKPNVGKSSILNYLTGEDRAIVTDIAGTTRDVIEEFVHLGGVPVKLMDTAGIHETDDVVEKIGVQKSLNAADKATFVLAVFDGSKPLDEKDKEVLKLVENRPHAIVLNKCDLGKVVDLDGMEVSAKNGDGMHKIVDMLVQFAEEDVSESENIITNERHYECLLNCKQAVDRAIESAEFGMPVDMLTVDIQTAIENLGEITGQTVSQEIVDRVFHNFCLGK
ncbi:MAG: tRNA uridine-5-carboxymethylaminomethyl(34) synthesis GTPase MnmE [Clostridia bacterium]|nr:tRNA uridine-5-carboxymethylaminomethyl(34) synthesis GTPase MnmE [Clostridia bacterium]